MHYAIRALVHSAARHGDIDSDRVSFTRALPATRRSVRTGLSATITLTTALNRGITEILDRLLQPRRPRSHARVVRRKISTHDVKRACHRTWPHPTMPTSAAIHVLSPP